MQTAHDLARDTVWNSLMLLLTVAALCIGVVIIGGVQLVGQPLSRLVEKAKRIGEGDFSGPIVINGRTELNDLAGAMNEMCEKLEVQRSTIKTETASRLSAENQLRHADRLNTVGRLAAGVAHEMGTPLNVVSGRAGLIASGQLNDEEVRGSAQTIKEEADRIARIIRGLLDFARRTNPDRELANPHTVVEQTVELLRDFAKKKAIDVTVDSPSASSLSVNVDVGQLQQVLTNLIMNAVQAMPSGGRIDIAVAEERATAPPDMGGDTRDCIRIGVTDTGGGISTENQERIFEPFFTTKDVGEGTGLGLAISYGIIRDHDGWIDMTSEPDRGTCFSIFLPTAISR